MIKNVLYLAPLGIDGLINPFLVEEKRITLDGYGFKARKIIWLIWYEVFRPTSGRSKMIFE